MGVFRCIKCEKSLLFADFTKNKSKPSGKNSICKKCDAEQSKIYYNANKERVIQRHRTFYQANREKCQTASRFYYQAHRQECLLRDYEAHLKDPLRKKCQNKTQYAIRTGVLVIHNCTDCGLSPKTEKIQAHHEDYEKPLIVIWLCASCHLRRHFEQALEQK